MSVREQRSGEVTVTGVRQQGDNGLPLVFRPLGQRDGCPDRGTRGDADQNTFGLTDFFAGGKGSLVLHGDDLVIDTGVQHIRNKAGTNALNLVRAGAALAQTGGTGTRQRR